jgi:uncharacterized protein (DUF1330 family)
LSAGYVLVDVEWLDPDARARYVAEIEDSIALYGGEFVARSPEYVTLEGDWRFEGRLVMLRFPTVTRALEWYRSDIYAPLLEVRKGGARTKIICFEGV